MLRNSIKAETACESFGKDYFAQNDIMGLFPDTYEKTCQSTPIIP